MITPSGGNANVTPTPPVSDRTSERSAEVVDSVVLGASDGPTAVRKPFTTRATLLRSPDEAVAFMQRFNQRLGLKGDRLQEKVGRMQATAHNFFRATPALFTHDMMGPYAGVVRLLPRPSPQCDIALDVHLENFGTYVGPDGKPVWGFNDFDQSDRGPAEWDLVRLATSITLAGRMNGIAWADIQQAIHQMAAGYVSELNAAGPEAMGFFQAGEGSPMVNALIEEAGRQSNPEFYRVFFNEGPPGTFTIRPENEMLPIPDDLTAEVHAVLQPDRVLGCGHKSGSGGSSRGLNRIYAVVEPADGGPRRLMEVKQVLPSPFVDREGNLAKADAQHIADQQRLLTGTLNPHTQAVWVQGGSYLVKPRESEKMSIEWEQMPTPAQLAEVASQTGRMVARMHARQRGVKGELQSWIGSDTRLLQTRLADVSQHYADQTEADWRAFKEV